MKDHPATPRSGPAARPLLLLWGFMGTGKSTVGPLVARSRAAKFLDLDRRLEEHSTRRTSERVSVAELFTQHGEQHFRELEREQLLRIFDDEQHASEDHAESLRESPLTVVALGGGTLLDDELRRVALARAFVVVLDASAAVIAQRTKGSDRPLLASHPGEMVLSELQTARAAAYAEAHVRVATDALTPPEVAARVAATWLGQHAR